MASNRQQAESDDAPGAPEWMVTFSDCMTLLLTFFVLLLSFSSFDKGVFRNLKLIFADAMPAVSKKPVNSDAFLFTEQIRPSEDVVDGSEKPTLEKGVQEGSRQDTEPVDFRSKKVFLISSRRAFWGKGTRISLEGREFLANLASFLKHIPNRVVVSEHSSAGTDSEQLGLLRAWEVVQYLSAKQGLDKGQFSVSAMGTVPEESIKRGRLLGSSAAERVLELVLLERSMYE